MKQKSLEVIAAILMLSFLCASCTGNTETADDTDTQSSLSLQNDPHDGLGGGSAGITEIDTRDLAGIYMPVDNTGEWDYLDLHDDGTWMLYGQNADISGWLGYDEEYEAAYAYEDGDGSGSLFYVDDSDGTLYFAAYGYFYGSGMDNMWYEEDSGGGDHDGSGLSEEGYFSSEEDMYEEAADWNPDLYQHDVADFAGTWYYDGDLSAETYIVIDTYGNWSYYQRAPGAEAEEMDCGTFSYSTDEASIYYADSTMYDGVSYQVFEFDDDILIWGDEGTYEWKE